MYVLVALVQIEMRNDAYEVHRDLINSWNGYTFDT